MTTSFYAVAISKNGEIEKRLACCSPSVAVSVSLHQQEMKEEQGNADEWEFFISEE